MPDDFDHEVIDSPQALLRHLYEAHGVEEARDVNPNTAPVQFWVRRHAELERAGATPRERPSAPPAPAQGQAVAPPPAQGRATAPTAAPGPASAPPTAPGPTPNRPAASEPRPPSAGPRYRPFADPLVEAAVTALVRRGLEERQVRRWIASHGGEEAVRATFLDPVVDALAARMRDGGEGRPEGQGRPIPAAPRSAPAPPAPPPAAPLDADFMAIADVLQSRRRRGGRGQREPSPQPPARADDHDDYMAVANAVQRGRRRG
jgi:hypothetical protein